MKNILIAVDDTKSTERIFSKFKYLCKCLNPELITLVYVEKLEGASLMDEMLGDPEMETLRETLEGSEYKEELDQKANRILKKYKQELIGAPPTPNVKTIIRTGHPADEILKVAKEENIDMIIVGSRKVNHFLIGSVSKEVLKEADVPVLVAR
jgi:nucleotide-binding universal stress UspA family protein